ncbi:MAG: OmpH family outer membrane protein [Selenomonadaceae bacterium]|nr:OmpH family outer membrane protein [Selenomonadaceae bacterium]
MNEAPQIKSIMDEGAKKIEEIQQEAAALQDNTEMTDEERSKAQSDIQRKLIGVNQAYATQLQHKINETLAGIAQEKKLDVVIDSSESQPVVFEGGVDVTAELIQKLQ